MSEEVDKLWCIVRDTRERVTELETRLSLLEDEEDVTLEDWEDDGDDTEDCEYEEFQDGVDWDDDDDEEANHDTEP